MEKIKPENCRFGQHIHEMDKQKLVDLCHRISRDEPLEALKELKQEDLIQKYQSVGMEVIFNPYQ